MGADERSDGSASDESNEVCAEKGVRMGRGEYGDNVLLGTKSFFFLSSKVVMFRQCFVSDLSASFRPRQAEEM